MSRRALVVVLFAVGSIAGCGSKSTGTPEQKAVPVGDKVVVPGGEPPTMGKGASTGAATMGGGGADDPLTLHAAEGSLAISPPTDAKAGAEAVAHIVLTPGSGYHVNTEFPIKLTLESRAGVTLAQGEFVAGGHDKSKGDAEALDEQKLDIAVRLTPAAAGTYTIKGKFKFAVCDATSCLPKKEDIAISIAAK